jgi:SAM-dependent methyltransferase
MCEQAISPPTRVYDGTFFKSCSDASASSARAVLGLIWGYIRPKAVLDLGCGIGNWLEVARELGSDRLLGIDGEYVDRSLLRIPQDEFRIADLTERFSVESRFDLALCLEVAEHLHESSADALVSSLTSCADMVLFSAAIPGQGGNSHVNEQWPDYWSERFRVHDYEAYDCIRDRVWTNSQVAWWYAQNSILYLRRGVGRSDTFARWLGVSGTPLRRVHPGCFEYLRSDRDDWQTGRHIPRVRTATSTFLKSLTASLCHHLRIAR